MDCSPESLFRFESPIAGCDWYYQGTDEDRIHVVIALSKRKTEKLKNEKPLGPILCHVGFVLRYGKDGSALIDRCLEASFIAG